MVRKKQKNVLKMVLCAVLVLVIAVFVSCYNRPVCTGSQCEAVGNEHCPVTGRPVDGVNTYDHHGKRYNLCSPHCAEPLSQCPPGYQAE